MVYFSLQYTTPEIEEQLKLLNQDTTTKVTYGSDKLVVDKYYKIERIALENSYFTKNNLTNSLSITRRVRIF